MCGSRAEERLVEAVVVSSCRPSYKMLFAKGQLSDIHSMGDVQDIRSLGGLFTSYQ